MPATARSLCSHSGTGSLPPDRRLRDGPSGDLMIAVAAHMIRAGGNAMSLPSKPPSPGLTALLRGVVADLHRASGADIVSLFLYDEEGPRYYAPFAVGQPEDSLLDSLADMREQLNRYLA